MELRAEHERDPEPRGAGSGHGQALGHRWIRRHEESKHGKSNGPYAREVLFIFE